MLAGGYKYAICGHRSAGSPRPSGCDSGFAFFKFQLARFLGADRCVIGTYYFVPLSLLLHVEEGLKSRGYRSNKTNITWWWLVSDFKERSTTEVLFSSLRQAGRHEGVVE